MQTSTVDTPTNWSSYHGVLQHLSQKYLGTLLMPYTFLFPRGKKNTVIYNSAQTFWGWRSDKHLRSVICILQFNKPEHNTSPGPCNSIFNCCWCSYYPKFHIQLCLSLDPKSWQFPYSSRGTQIPQPRIQSFHTPVFCTSLLQFYRSPIVRMVG